MKPLPLSGGRSTWRGQPVTQNDRFRAPQDAVPQIAAHPAAEFQGFRAPQDAVPEVAAHPAAEEDRPLRRSVGGVLQESRQEHRSRVRARLRAGSAVNVH